MSLSLDHEHLKRYKDLAWLLIKYGRSDLLSGARLDKVIMEEERLPEQVSSKAENFPRDLEKMGPTYVKLGQFLSTRSDLFPPEYVEALSRLQDRAEQFPYEIVEKIVTSELGKPIHRLFASFDKEPLAAASLAQAHLATLMDGRSVAVKVQRPEIRARIVADLDVLMDVTGFLDRHTEMARYMLHMTIDEFRKAILRELDFRQEARNLAILGENLKDFGKIVVPCPIEGHTTSKVLTMDFIRGQKVTGILPLRGLKIDGAQLA